MGGGTTSFVSSSRLRELAIDRANHDIVQLRWLRSDRRSQIVAGDEYLTVVINVKMLAPDSRKIEQVTHH